MSEPSPRRSDKGGTPPKAVAPAPESQEFAETMPLDSITHGDKIVPPEQTLGPGGVDATHIDASLKDASFIPTMDLGTQADRTGTDKTLDFVVSEVKRKASAVLHTTVGDYEIDRELGRGGMGVVYKARHRQLRRDVALKMILSGKHAGPEQLERFLIEAQAVAQLQHPNIVQIFDIGEHEGLPYFSLEYVDGQSLAQQVNRQPQPPQEAAQVLETLARTMQYAHDHGVLHRDLKPANVLLTKEGVPKISDFGLAKKFDDEEAESTRTGTVMGTPSYMPPEQAMGLTHDLGPHSDQYSLGAMLYEMLTGRPPFLSSRPVDTIMQVIHEEPVRPRQLQPTLPADIETICLKALQKDTEKRYASCLELAADLRRFLNGEPIVARPVGDLERFWRWCKRNPRVAIPSGLAVASLLAGIIILAWSWVTVSQQNVVIKQERDKAIQQENLAKSAQKTAEEQRDIATTQSKLAVDTLYNVVVKVDGKLKDRPDMRDLRQELVGDAMNGLERVEQSDHTKSLVDRSMGVGHQRIADVYQQMGRTPDAIAQQEKALVIFQHLMKADAQNDWAKWDAALSNDSLGTLTRSVRGDINRTREYYNTALKLREELGTGLHIQDPDLTPTQVALSLINSYAKMISLVSSAADDPATDEYVSKMSKTCDSLLAADPKNLQVRQAVAGSNLLLGGISARKQDLAAAADYYEKCLTIRQTLADESPQSLKAQLDLIRVLSNRGNLELQQNKRPAAAVPYYQRALKVAQNLFARDENDADVRGLLASCYHSLGTAHTLLSDNAAAMENFKAALSLRRTLVADDPKNSSKQIDLMQSLARVGEVAEASQLGESLLAQVGKDYRPVYNIACGFAICAANSAPSNSSEDNTTLQRFVDRALETLQLAVKLGYRDANALRTDPDLTAIRQDTRFTALVAELQKKPGTG